MLPLSPFPDYITEFLLKMPLSFPALQWPGLQSVLSASPRLRGLEQHVGEGALCQGKASSAAFPI